jgi:hypothetical protein
LEESWVRPFSRVFGAGVCVETVWLIAPVGTTQSMMFGASIIGAVIGMVALIHVLEEVDSATRSNGQD